jgi:tRNA-splicing ligase RtcB
VQKLGGKARCQLSAPAKRRFFELCLDTDQQVWIMLHSGSTAFQRGTAEIHMARAKCPTRRALHLATAIWRSSSPEPGIAAYRLFDLFWARHLRPRREVMLDLAFAP